MKIPGNQRNADFAHTSPGYQDGGYHGGYHDDYHGFPISSTHPHPKRQNLGRRAIFLKREAPGISVKSPLQKTSQLRQLGRSQTPRTHVRTRLLQALALPLLPSPALAVQAKALLSTSCPSPPTLSKCLFFQKHELSKTVSLPELESEIITPRNTRFLGKPSEPPACLWTRQSGVC